MKNKGEAEKASRRMGVLKKVKLSILSIAIASICLAVCAATPAASTAPLAKEDPRARQIIDHLYVTAKQLPIIDLVIELEESKLDSKRGGTGQLVPTGKDKIFFKKPNKFRIETVLHDPGGPYDGAAFTIYRDGVMAFMYKSGSQYPAKKMSDTQEPPLNVPYFLATYPRDSEKVATLAGEDVFDGIRVTVVKLTNTSNPEETVTAYIDRARWVPLKIDLKLPGRGEKGTTTVKKTVLYKDIRLLSDGRYFPFKLEILVDGVLNQVLVYKAVAVNRNLSDDLFKPMEKFMR